MSNVAFQLSRETPDTLTVHGELTFDTAAAALQAIHAALLETPAARLDLANVQRSDSAGLACVLAAQAEASRRGRPLNVCNMPAAMRTLARVCEVETLAG